MTKLGWTSTRYDSCARPYEYLVVQMDFVKFYPLPCFGPLLSLHVNHSLCPTMERSVKIDKPKATARQAETKKRATNLVDKSQHDDKLPSSSRRELKRRSTEEETEKAVHNNFRGFTETHRTMVLDKEVKSICDRVRAEKRKKRRGPSFTIGKKFHWDLKHEFFGDLGPTQDFQKPLESDLADERLFGCLRSVLQHNRNFVQVHAGSGQGEHSELAGLPESSPQDPARRQEPLRVELLARCHGVHRRRYVRSVSPFNFDQALVKDFASYRSNNRTGKVDGQAGDGEACAAN